MSLYRKYRPQTYASVTGQQSVVQTFLGAVRSGHIGHAYLLTGPRGTGKTTLARLFTKAINCENPQEGAPCGTCSVCVAVAEGHFLDLIEIDGASTRGIDDIRDLKEKAQYMPNIGRYKVYLIDEVHMLTGPAFNALLKILEEPPAHVVFILATTEANKIPVTILSRCQRLDLTLIQAHELKQSLRTILDQEQLLLNDDQLERVIELSGRSFRDALSILDRVQSYMSGASHEQISIETILGLPSREKITQLLSLIDRADFVSSRTVFLELIHAGVDPETIIKELIEMVRQQLLIAHGLEERKELDPKMQMSAHKLRTLLDALMRVGEKRTLYIAPQLIFELALMELAVLSQHTSSHDGESVIERSAPPAPAAVPAPSPPSEAPKTAEIVSSPQQDMPVVAPSHSAPVDTLPERLGDWQTVLSDIKKNAISLYLVFVSAHHECDDVNKKIIITLENSFYLRRVEERKNFEIIDQIMKKHFSGYALTLKVKEKQNEEQVNIVDEALELFDGELIE